MDDAVYRIVEHDGGWAYKLGDVFSETFPNRNMAEAAAKRVAEEQRSPGEDEAISWEDERGIWHDEAARGIDRPNAYVAGGETFQQSAPAQRPRSVGRDDAFGAAAERNQSGYNGQPARGEVRSDPLIVMLLTIALAYVLGLVVGRNA